MQLLQYFTELSMHPKNAAELKGLILQLAVQGKLTAQWRKNNPDVEPASELLERIQTEKAKLVKEKKIKREKPLAAIDEGEMPFELPNGWVWCRLGDLSVINGGFAFKSSQYVDEGTRVIRISDFDERGFKDDKVVRYEFSDDLQPYLLEERNILMAMTGGTVGKTFFVKKLSEPMVVNQRVATVKVWPSLEEAYINCLMSTNLVKDVIANAKNSTNDNISMSDIKGFLVPLTSVEEQKAIVTIVEQLFEEVEQLETLTEQRVQLKQDFVTSALQKLTTQDTQTEWAFLAPHFKTFFTEEPNVAKLREAILQLAVQGKLTKKWRSANQNVEPASKLLERIQAEKVKLVKEKKIKKEKPLPPIAEDEVPYELPEGWVWCRLGELGEYQKGNAFKSADYVDSGVPITKIKNLNDKHFGNSVYIEENKAKEFSKFLLQTGDIVMTTVGSWFSAADSAVGKSFLIGELFNETLLNQNTVRIRFYGAILQVYIYAVINSPSFQRYIEEEAQGTANQASITQQSIKSFVVPLPAIEEQRAIVTIVEQLFELCDRLEQAIQTNQTTQEQWMQSCIKEVFEEPKDVLV